MTLLPTESITARTASFGPPDKYGEETINYTDTVVDGCIVSPLSSVEQLAPFELSDLTKISISIPSHFTAEFGNAEVIVRGKLYKVIGNPIASMGTTLSWNRNIICEEKANG